MAQKKFSTVYSIMEAIARMMNLIDRELEHHHEQTALIAYMIAQTMQLSEDERQLVARAAILHDLGAVLAGRSHHVSSGEEERDDENVEIGADMMRELPGYERIAEIIQYCEYPWRKVERKCPPEFLKKGAVLSGIVHIAHFVSLRIKQGEPILLQRDRICDLLSGGRKEEFCPQAVDAFISIRGQEVFWMDAAYHPDYLHYFVGDIREVSLEETAELTKLMSQIIDFRSSFTAMHSAGVAAAAVRLSELCGMSKEECVQMEIAGYLHDLGKIIVPRSILEKPGRLTDDEFDIIKEHPYWTRSILLDVKGFLHIADWAGFHHEKLTGNGYPFHVGEERLDTGARIMAVADIFSALSEIPPYRPGLKKDEVVKIMRENERNRAIDPDITDVLVSNYDDINTARDVLSREVGKKYFELLGKEVQ